MIRMGCRSSDLQYTAARLVQECINNDKGNLSFGIWNADRVLTEEDAHGDGGVILIDVSDGLMEFKCMGGYWRDGDSLPERKTYEEMDFENFYNTLKSINA
jgi:hypothetical protein